ncbi:MAG: AlkA N-terminal domain-containing protein [Thermoanaerobaculia bacterium]
MELDATTCYRALAARDARFDGRFFTGVLTTGVYCRPICPARTPKLENVQFFACAAGAEEAGFRACRRCRPETAPGTPAWSGKSATVARALRLIELDDRGEAGLDEIAGRLGVGARHLRRLFHDELGASPKAVEITRRAHFARRLLVETALPVSRIAFTAGFGSLRRFNEVMKRSFGASPVALRSADTSRPDRGADGVLSLEIPFRPPSPWRTLSSFLGRRAIPGVEEAGARSYRRTFRVGKSSGIAEIRPIPGKNALELRVPAVASEDLLELSERARRLFDTDAAPAVISAHLRRDPALAERTNLAEGIRLPGCWDPFEMGVRAILGQQITVAGARTLAGRLAAMAGPPLAGENGSLSRIFPEAAAVAHADLKDLGVPRSRGETLRAFAAAFSDGRLARASAAGLDALLGELRLIPGIGDWTANYIAMRAFGEPDAFPAGDLGLRKAFASGGRPASARDLERISQNWRPWRAYAAVALWEGLS